MEMPEPAEWMQRPELDRKRPARLFLYAEEKQRWLRERVHEHQLPGAIDHLAEELDGFITTAFEGLPEVTIVTRDVNYTRSITEQGSAHAIGFAPLPLEGDAQLYGEHNITGHLFGFHQGERHDIRAYIAIGDGVRQLPGGIYTPLLSVGIEHSEIRFAEFSVAEQIVELGEYVKEQLKSFEPSVGEQVKDLLNKLNDPQNAYTRKLHISSPIIAEIARSTMATPQFIDALLEIVKLKLRLDTPHDILTSSHRVVITKGPVNSYKAQQGPTSFSEVTPELGLIGESANRGLGLFFIKDDTPIQIPVQYITSIYKSQQ